MDKTHQIESNSPWQERIKRLKHKRKHTQRGTETPQDEKAAGWHSKTTKHKQSQSNCV